MTNQQVGIYWPLWIKRERDTTLRIVRIRFHEVLAYLKAGDVAGDPSPRSEEEAWERGVGTSLTSVHGFFLKGLMHDLLPEHHTNLMFVVGVGCEVPEVDRVSRQRQDA